MANYPRSLIVFDGSLFHVTWKCHNNDWLLASDFAKSHYYNLLLKYKDRYSMTFFSYCLMDNHIHLTGQCVSQKLFSDFFRVVNSCFAKTLNKKQTRKGQAVMDRFKSPTMQTDDDLMNVIIYNDMNPFRTIKGTHPKNFKWTSYHHYARGKTDPLLTDPECYNSLANTPQARQSLYRSMINEITKHDHRAPKCPYKQDERYSCFVGDPEWVNRHYQTLMKRVRIRRKEWQDRH